MKWRYLLRYAWKDIWDAANLPFSIINLLAIGITVTILVMVTGLFVGFRNHGDKIIGAEALRIEVSHPGEKEITLEEKQKLESIAGVSSVYFWNTIVLLFYDQHGALKALEGRTIELDDPRLDSLKSMQREKIRFCSKKEKGHKLDEIGFLMPFSVLKDLAYLPQQAVLEKPKTWEHISWNQISRKPVRLYVQEKGKVPMDLEVPVVGVIPEFDSNHYLMTTDFYGILGDNWRDEFVPFLKDRRGELLKSSRTVLPSSQNDAQAQRVQANDQANPLELQRRHVTGGKCASVYVQERKDLLPIIRRVREMGMRADCGLEETIADYQEQDRLFRLAALGVCLTLILFTGIVLFANFHSLVAQKVPEIAILKACGSSHATVGRLLAMETSIVSTMAIVFGAAAGMLGGWQIGRQIQKYLPSADVQWFAMSWEYLVVIFICGLLFCRVVTFFPVRVAVKLDPAQAIRT